MSRRGLWLACTALTVAAAPAAYAQTAWDGSASTDWFTAANWSAGVPGAGSTITIDTASPNSTLIGGGAAQSSIARIGSGAGSFGILTVDGAGTLWSNSVGAVVGLNGTGFLNITDGATVNNTNVELGTTFTASGRALVSGPGSAWNNSGSLTVGQRGFGMVTVENGASLNSQSAFIGGGGSGSGAVVINNASWTNTGEVRVGDIGGGSLRIANGGTVNNTSAVLGDFATGAGQVVLSGSGSAWVNTGFLIVAAHGSGELTVENGAMLSSQRGFLGEDEGTGRVVVSNAAWSNALDLTIGFDGSGTLTLQNGGTASANGVFIATRLGSHGTLNIGAAAGAAPAAPGTLDAPSVGFGVGTGLIVFNHTATGYAFTPAIAGSGSLLFEAGTTSLTATSPFSGPATVDGGALLVNGSIANATTTVNAGGTLGGSGIVGNTAVNGGTLSPGNSIGTLTVQGSLTFTAASTYLLEVNPGTSDRTNVTATATLGGATVSAQYAPGSYVSKRYIILNAAGGVNGTFSALVNTNLPATMPAVLRYDSNNVYLDLAFDPSQFAPGFGPGLSGNQASVANALVNSFNAAGGIPLAFGALTPQGLTQVSGEAATGTQQTAFSAVDTFMNMMTDPFIGGRSDAVLRTAMDTRDGSAPQGGGATGYADEDDALAYASKRKGRTAAEAEAYARMAVKAPPRVTAFERRWSVWGAGYGGAQSTDGDAAVGSSAYTARIYGVAAGFDYRLAPDTLVGFSLGGAGTKYDLAGGLGGGRSEMFQAGIYGRHQFGPAYIAGALAYAWQDVTTDRTVFFNSYRASFDDAAISGRLEGGYRFALGMSGLTPYAAGQFATFFLPDYAEQTVAGLNTFALAFAARDITASRSELGLRADTSFAAQDAVVTLRARAAWAHNFDTDRSLTATFQTLPASAFVVNGASPAENAVLLSAGAKALWLNGVSVAATFEGEFSNVTESYAGKGVIRYQW